MNRLEFEQEVLKSDICPPNFEVIYKEFMNFQDEAIKTLNEFHRVCEKNGVRYQLAYGSLLGAVRDNGQIPWDYDIDVIVPYNEKDKLVQVLRNDLSDDFYFHCPEQDEKCRHFIMRLAPKGYKTTKLHIDVFYAIGAPEDSVERCRFEKEMQEYFHLRYHKLVKYEDLPRLRNKIGAFVRKIRLIPVTVNIITKNMKAICEKYNLLNSKCCIIVCGEYQKQAFETSKLWNTMLLNTAIGTFRVSKNYDYVLKILYGNYLKIYPLENRLNEMITHYNMLTGSNITLPFKSTTGRYYMDRNNLR